MMAVAIRRRLGTFDLDVAFTAPADGITMLFGPSGAGKSSILAAIGGLSRPDAGRIAVADRLLFDSAAGVDIPPQRRGIGWVHQDARLFPHLPVEGNLRYGQRRARGTHRIGFDEVVEVLAIRSLLGRRVATLSGGERQRVALGRALLSQPALLLLDEPLAALDAPRKREIIGFIARLRGRFGLPMLYVTHDREEVRALADHVVHLAAGRVVPAPAEGVRETVGIVVADADGVRLRTDTGALIDLSGIDAVPGERVTIRVEPAV